MPAEKPTETSGPSSSENPLRVALDYWKGVLGFKRELNELKSKIEADKNVIRKDGLEFRAMQFEGMDEKDEKKREEKQKRQLEGFVVKLPQTIDKKTKVPLPAPKVKTAFEMAAELPEPSYSKLEKELIGKYIQSTQYNESLGQYEVLGVRIDEVGNRHFGDRALGKYQPMPKNWLAWSKELFDGKVVEPDRQAQEYVAFRQFMKNFDELRKEYKTDYPKLFYAMGSRWYGGGIKFKFMGEVIPTGGWDTQKYCQRILEKMGMPQTLGEKAKAAIGAAYEKASRWIGKKKKEMERNRVSSTPGR